MEHWLADEESDGGQLVNAIGESTVGHILRDHRLKPWREKKWCVPKLNEEYRDRMEDILSCYEEPDHPEEPLIAVDEVSKQLLADKRPGRPCRPGKVARQDYEYARQGTRNLFVMVSPH